MKVAERSASMVRSIKSYWKLPPPGRYMSFKEIVSLSVGGIGVKFVVYCVQNMILSINNTLIGNTIGIAPRPLYWIYLLSVLAGFPLTALRARIIDSARDKKGKYRPYILYMGLPTVILAVGFTWMPYDGKSMLWKCVVVLLFNIGFQFFYNFLYDANDSIINVLSPNTIERSDVCSIKTITDSMAPSIANIVIPLLARLITGQNSLFDMRIYRAVYPPMLIGGFLLALLIYTNTKEKIVQAKTHVVQVKFIDAFRVIIKNKYFWIISLAGWLGFLEGSFGSIMGWLYHYQNACSAGTYSLITAINGNASLWPMLVAPFLIRAIGKKNMLIYSNLLSIVFIFAMYPVVQLGSPQKIIWLILICMFFNNIATMLGHILAPSLNGDIRDYQQYITGERIDGMFAAVGLIGSVITMGTSLVLPQIYDRAGLNEAVAMSLGYDGSNVYDVLYNTEYFRSVCGVLVLASVAGAALNVVPFFFYDLSEVKQKAMVTVLKIRALFEDYGNGALSDEALVEAIDMIEEAKNYADRQPADISKERIRQARHSGDGHSAVKQARAALKQDRQLNEKIEISKYVMKEMNRFETAEGIEQIARAQRIVHDGLDGLAGICTITVAEAKAMPSSTQDEKALRRLMIDTARQERYSNKVISKHYSSGITELDARIIQGLFDKEDTIDAELKQAYKELEEARRAGEADKTAELKGRISELRAGKAEMRREIKNETNRTAIYNRAAKPYLDAKKLLIQKENYKRYEEIKQGYEESLRRAEQERERKRIESENEGKGKFSIGRHKNKSDEQP